jgi:hypothetical protein
MDHHDRGIAASTAASGSFEFLGDVVGAGNSRVIAEAEFSDGKRARSAPFNLSIAYTNPPAGGIPNNAPIAHGYLKDVYSEKPLLLELPATDREDRIQTFVIDAGPAQATIQGLGPTVLLRPNFNAMGTDTVVFRAHDGQAWSNAATITIRYLFEADLTWRRPRPTR